MLPALQNFNLDAAESFFIERQLETVRSKIYEVKYAELVARTLIPVSNEDDPGAETIRYDIYDSVGVAKIVASYAKDFPRADVKVREERAVVKSIGNAYAYNIQEMRAAALAKRPLEQRKANSARKAQEQEVERIALLGDQPNNLVGLFNVPNALGYAAPNNAAGTSTTWANKSPDEILRDLNGPWKVIRTTTKDVEKPDTMLMPIGQHALISTTPRSPVSDTTILEFFLANNPDIKSVIPIARLAGQGAGGSDRMVVYRRDPDALQLAIPQEFEQFPPQTEGMELSIPCHSRCAGVLVFYPLSICYADGI